MHIFGWLKRYRYPASRGMVGYALHLAVEPFADMLLLMALSPFAVVPYLLQNRFLDHLRRYRLTGTRIPATPLRIRTYVIPIAATLLPRFARDHDRLTGLTPQQTF